jgi:S-adenosylmethionine synthetase
VDSYGSGVLPDERLATVVRESLDLRPRAVVEHLRLRELPARHDGAFYVRLAAYGQLGRTDVDAPWERDDRAQVFRACAERLG